MSTPTTSSTSSRSFLSCGSLETRFTFSLLSFLVVCLFWSQQDFVAMIALLCLTVLALVILVRILLLARYRPHLLYSIRRSELGRVFVPAQARGQIDLTAALNLNPTHLRLAMMDRDFTPNDYELLLGLDEDLRAQQFTGISQADIERLPTYIMPSKTTEEGENQTTVGTTTAASAASDASVCAICLEPKLPGQLVRVLPCLHSFHAESCIDPWLRTSPLCPVDKFRINM